MRFPLEVFDAVRESFPADRPVTVGLVPLGYADGVPRHASGVAQVQTRAGRAPVRP